MVLPSFDKPVLVIGQDSYCLKSFDSFHNQGFGDVSTLLDILAVLTISLMVFTSNFEIFSLVDFLKIFFKIKACNMPFN